MEISRYRRLDLSLCRGEGLAVAEEQKKRWRAFTCPECQMIFRVESGFTGKGVICRNCHFLLRLPERQVAGQANGK